MREVGRFRGRYDQRNNLYERSRVCFGIKHIDQEEHYLLQIS